MKKEIENHIGGRIKDYEMKIHTEEYISNDEEPVRAIRRKERLILSPSLQ